MTKSISHYGKHVGVEGLLGCKNRSVLPFKAGQTVLDLGCGNGLDCIEAFKKVGSKGKVIGIDNNREMISAANENCQKYGYLIQFILSNMEKLSIEDRCVDVIVANFAINHSSNKLQVFREAFRVLKPGGTLVISDVVATSEIPEKIIADLKRIGSCTAESSSVEQIEEYLTSAGFESVTIKFNEASGHLMEKLFQVEGLEKFVTTANILAAKSNLI